MTLTTEMEGSNVDLSLEDDPLVIGYVLKTFLSKLPEPLFGTTLTSILTKWGKTIRRKFFTFDLNSPSSSS